LDQIGKVKSDTLKENIKRINKEIKLVSHNVLIEESNFEELFQECDLVIEAFDRPESKEMIVRAMSKFFSDKTLVMGIGMSGWGQNDSIKETQRHCEALWWRLNLLLSLGKWVTGVEAYPGRSERRRSSPCGAPEIGSDFLDFV